MLCCSNCDLSHLSIYSDTNTELERLRQENAALLEQLAALKHQLKKSEEDAAVKEAAFNETKFSLESEISREKERVVTKEAIIKEKTVLVDNQKVRLDELEDALQSAKRGLANSINEKNVLSKEVLGLTEAKQGLQDENNVLSK